jgi:ERF superfamily
METEDHKGIDSAMAALQAQLPRIGKASTAQYGRYADLADVTGRIMPLLGRHGLSFVCMPDRAEDGATVLRYELRHVTGEKHSGTYLLSPGPLKPQDMGSAITYARRYALCAVTGVAPDEDDDDAQAAQQASVRRAVTPAGPRASRASQEQLGEIRHRLESLGVTDPAQALQTMARLAKVSELRRAGALTQEQGELVLGALRTITTPDELNAAVG